MKSAKTNKELFFKQFQKIKDAAIIKDEITLKIKYSSALFYQTRIDNPSTSLSAYRTGRLWRGFLLITRIEL